MSQYGLINTMIFFVAFLARYNSILCIPLNVLVTHITYRLTIGYHMKESLLYITKCVHYRLVSTIGIAVFVKYV